MRRSGVFLFAYLLLPICLPAAAESPQLSSEVQAYVKIAAPMVALTHVTVIDGTGAPARGDQTILISNGNIAWVGEASHASLPGNAKVLELRGYSVIPGLVDMHGHMFYTAGNVFTPQGKLAVEGITLNEMAYSYPRLYLAAGVTTVRTAGTIEPYTDLNLKRWIDQGKMPGPKMHVTSPYLEGEGTMFPQMHELTGPDDARKTVAYWADEGVTSFKAYMNITRAELAAAIAEAHKRGLKVTGHLCSISSREAAALGIDNLEHGPLLIDTEFTAGKKPDVCPPGNLTLDALASMEVHGARAQAIMRDLIKRRVAVTSTLPVFEQDLPDRPPLRKEALDSMLPQSRESYLSLRAKAPRDARLAQRFQRELQFERAFVNAGGTLLAGSDPTGVGFVVGGDLAGFGQQREVELLVEAGFTPVEAIHIATENGARFLGEGARIGTIAAGKRADLAVIRGDPARNISDVEKVETVFKDGIGYDCAALLESVRGMVGLR